MNPKRSSAQILSAVFGFMMMAVSTPCVLAMFYDILIAGTDNVMGAMIVGVFMGFVGIAGIAMFMFGLKKPAATPQAMSEMSAFRRGMAASDLEAGVISQELEREILKFAKDHNGRLTIAEIAVSTDLRADEARQLMDYLVANDVAQTHLSEGGNIVYVFPGFATNKMAAVNPLDDMAMFDRELGMSDDVVFDQGMDGNVEFDTTDDEAAEEAVVQPQNSTEKW